MEENSILTRFISFDRFITPVIIKIIFYIGVALCLLMGLLTLFSSGNFLTNLIMALLTITLGPLFVKIYCELVIVLFQIHEVLVDIKKK